MIILKNCILAVIGFSSGLVVAAGIFAFIAVIGIVPRMAQRSKTVCFIPRYEDAIILGGIWGTLNLYIDFYIPIGTIGAILFAFSIGIFIGCLAVSLAEVLNVIPIFARRARLTQGIPIFVLALALGKMIGSLVYFFTGNFTG